MGEPLSRRCSGAALCAARSLAFSSDGKTLASGGYDGTITLWDVDAQQNLARPIARNLGVVRGLGFSPAFPQGPSLKQLAVGEPVSIDLAACVNGYVVDMTRMYDLGSLPVKAREAWQVGLQLYAWL